MDTDDPTEDTAPIVEFLGTLGVAPHDVPVSAIEASAMAADVILARGDKFSLLQLADETGLDTDQVGNIFRHLDITIGDADEIRFGDADVKLVRFFFDAVALLTEQEANELLHVLGVAVSSASEAAVTGHVLGPESRATSYLDGARVAAAMAEVGLELGEHLAAAFRHHLRQSMSRQRRVQSVEFRELHTLTVGFVDLVGFTTLSQTLEPADIIALITQFESRAHELAHNEGARIVKLIGDEVMFASESRVAGASFALGMLTSFGTSNVVPRGGLASGSVIAVHGDYFGSVVNLAARLVTTAVPGEILVDDSVAGATGVTTEFAGRRMLKGFDDPVRVHTLLVADRSP